MKEKKKKKKKEEATRLKNTHRTSAQKRPSNVHLDSAKK